MQSGCKLGYRMTDEMYHEVPTESSPKTVQQILDALMKVSSAQVWKSKKIVIRYLVNSRGTILDRAPRWIVNCYGFPPPPAKGVSDSTDDERSHLRFLFTEDGVFVQGDNQP